MLPPYTTTSTFSTHLVVRTVNLVAPRSWEPVHGFHRCEECFSIIIVELSNLASDVLSKYRNIHTKIKGKERAKSEQSVSSKC